MKIAAACGKFAANERSDTPSESPGSLGKVNRDWAVDEINEGSLHAVGIDTGAGGGAGCGGVLGALLATFGGGIAPGGTTPGGSGGKTPGGGMPNVPGGGLLPGRGLLTATGFALDDL